MNTQKMIMIPEWRYYKMLETYDNAMKELERLKMRSRGYPFP